MYLHYIIISTLSPPNRVEHRTDGDHGSPAGGRRPIARRNPTTEGQSKSYARGKARAEWSRALVASCSQLERLDGLQYRLVSDV